MNKLPRLLLAAPGSGGGKTTIACGLLQAFVDRGLSPGAFKCGPDYIDPMFHSEVIGVPSRNLDLFFSSEDTVCGLLARHGQGRHIALLEGVMGYYDGVYDTDQASSWHLAKATGTPVVLVLDPGGMSLSCAALVRGILGFRQPHQIVGILLNRCPPSLYRLLGPLLERECGVPVLGYLPPLPDCAIESRHLGLVTATEVEGLRQKIRTVAASLEAHVDLDRLLELAGSAAPLAPPLSPAAAVVDSRPVIAYGKDEAFCFAYPDNLELLAELGARLVPFSPLRDTALPAGAAALFLPGGYPELYAPTLSQNQPMAAAIRGAVAAGMPVLAECGGFQYLQSALTDRAGNRWPMAGVLPSESALSTGPRRFGYVTLTASRDTLLCKRGDTIRAHEFHHWDSTATGDAFVARKPSGKEWPCVVATENLFAGYPHLYFLSNPAFAARFVQAAAAYAGQAPWGPAGSGISK